MRKGNTLVASAFLVLALAAPSNRSAMEPAFSFVVIGTGGKITPHGELFPW